MDEQQNEQEQVQATDTVLCDVSEQDTLANSVLVGIGDSVICPTCHAAEQMAMRKLIAELNQPATIQNNLESVDVAVRSMVARWLSKQLTDNIKTLDQMREEIVEYMSLDADADQIFELYRMCTEGPN